jgi:demethylmenaquinone methyltransferase/2-methoxy-6-polyprenyl-1,4-benzoquinol methylase
MTLTNKTPETEVHDLFSRVAPKYDLMNNIVSLGVQKHWRQVFFKKLQVKKTDRCLDLCCGTGDITIGLAQRAATVVGLDFNQQMLTLAQQKIAAAHWQGSIQLVQGDAMQLPFRDQSFDCVTIAFGLRNVPDAGKTIAEAYRVLKKGGKFAVIEMSQPTNPVIKKAWQGYFKVFPYFAKLTKAPVADYEYLAKTSAAFLSARALKQLILAKGFRQVEVSKLTFGAGAIHLAIK